MTKRQFSLESVLKDARSSATNRKVANEFEEGAAGEGGGGDISPEELQALLEAQSASDAGGEGAGGDVELSPEEIELLLSQKAAALASVGMTAQLKEAQILGAAILDGFMSRANAAEIEAQKLAAVENIVDPDLEKIAEEIGFNQGVEYVMKLAQAQIEEGQVKAAQYVEQVKEAMFDQGHYDTLRVLSEIDEKYQ